MKTELYPAAKRQHIKHGEQLDSWQSFSFGNWYDKERTNFGPLRVFNDDTIGPGSEIGMHPHQNHEILSVMLDGRMSHKDSLGNYQELETDSIQLISCGNSIYHAGKNSAPNSYSHFLQVWVEPDVMNTIPDLQLHQFNQKDIIDKWDLRVSPVSESGKIKIKQNCFCSRGVFSGNISYTLHNAQNGVWLFVLGGVLEVNGIVARKRDALMVTEAVSFELSIQLTADVWLMELPVQKKKEP